MLYESGLHYNNDVVDIFCLKICLKNHEKTVKFHLFTSVFETNLFLYNSMLVLVVSYLYSDKMNYKW